MDAEEYSTFQAGARAYIDALHTNQRPSRNSKVFTAAIAA